MYFFPKTAAFIVDAQFGGKTLRFCSFSCAHRFHRAHTETGFAVRDYESGKEISASRAFFVLDSKNILKELPFDMAPTVVGFGAEASARSKIKGLGDGEVVQGMDALEKRYE